MSFLLRCQCPNPAGFLALQAAGTEHRSGENVAPLDLKNNLAILAISGFSTDKDNNKRSVIIGGHFYLNHKPTTETETLAWLLS